jgi:putative oxidoreductase
MSNLTTVLASFERAAASQSRHAPALLRLGLGAVFLAHGYAKLAVFTLPGTIAYFEGHGLPGWTVYPVLAVELLGGACLVAGIHVRLAALALLPVMLGALVPHVTNGWMFTNPGGGWEYVALLIVALTVQLLLGRGTTRPASQRAPSAELA